MRKNKKAPSLLAIREAHGWSQQETADKIGISRSYYAMLETASRAPSVAVAKKLSEVFHLEWYIFFDRREAI